MLALDLSWLRPAPPPPPRMKRPCLSADELHVLGMSRAADEMSACSIACILDDSDEQMFGVCAEHDDGDQRVALEDLELADVVRALLG